MNIITIDNVCKNYKTKKALDNVSLSIKQGELFGLLGVIKDMIILVDL